MVSVIESYIYRVAFDVIQNCKFPTDSNLKTMFKYFCAIMHWKQDSEYLIRDCVLLWNSGGRVSYLLLTYDLPIALSCMVQSLPLLLTVLGDSHLHTTVFNHLTNSKCKS